MYTCVFVCVHVYIMCMCVCMYVHTICVCMHVNSVVIINYTYPLLKNRVTKKLKALLYASLGYNTQNVVRNHNLTLYLAMSMSMTSLVGMVLVTRTLVGTPKGGVNW